MPAVAAQQARIATIPSPVQLAADGIEIGRIAIAARIDQLRHHGQASRDHQCSGRRGGEHEAPASPREKVRELLRERAAPGHAEHIDLVRVAQPREQLVREPGQRREPVRQERRRRSPHAGNVEDHDLGPRHRGDEGFDELEVGADPVEHQQRRRPPVAAADADAQVLAIDIDEPDFHG